MKIMQPFMQMQNISGMTAYGAAFIFVSGKNKQA